MIRRGWPCPIHHLFHDLATIKSQGATMGEFYTHARHLVELETALKQQIEQGGQRIEVTSQAIAHASQVVGAALDGFSQRLISGALPDTVEVKSTEGMEHEIDRLKREEVSTAIQCRYRNHPAAEAMG